MKRVANGGIDFTGAEQVLMALCKTHEGMRELADRRGIWNRTNLPGMDRSWNSSARRMLNLFGDWKLSGLEITDLCGQARETVGF